MPTKVRMAQLLSGLMISALFCLLYHYVKYNLSEAIWKINEGYSWMQGLSASWWTLKGVLYEELIFRGALLYLAIKWIGSQRAVWISAAAFGIYHWFSYSAFGNVQMMIYVFLLTGSWGWMFAYSFLKTRSMYLPVALHLGWNLVTIVILSNGPIGSQLLTIEEVVPIETVQFVLLFLFQILALPMLLYFMLRRLSANGK